MTTQRTIRSYVASAIDAICTDHAGEYSDADRLYQMWEDLTDDFLVDLDECFPAGATS